MSNSLKAAAAQKKGAPTPPFAEGMVALRQHAAQPQQPHPQLAQVSPSLTRPLVHAYLYTPTLTRRSSRARSSRKSRLLLHAYSCAPTLARLFLHAYLHTPTFTLLFLHVYSYTTTLSRRSSRALSSRMGWRIFWEIKIKDKQAAYYV